MKRSAAAGGIGTFVALLTVFILPGWPVTRKTKRPNSRPSGNGHRAAFFAS